MKQEWCCTSKVIARIILVFLTSIQDELKTQVCDFINAAVTRLFCRQCAGKRAGQGCHVCRRSSVRKETPTSIKPEATLSDRIDWRISGQPEEPHTLNEKEATVFLISMLITDLIKNHAQKNTARVDYYPYHIEIQKFMLNKKKATWNDMQFYSLKILFDAIFF